MMADLATRAAMLQHEFLTLYVDKQNESAIRFYSNFGFKSLGDSHVDGHYLMALDLRGIPGGVQG